MEYEKEVKRFLRNIKRLETDPEYREYIKRLSRLVLPKENPGVECTSLRGNPKLSYQKLIEKRNFMLLLQQAE